MLDKLGFLLRLASVTVNKQEIEIKMDPPDRDDENAVRLPEKKGK